MDDQRRWPADLVWHFECCCGRYENVDGKLTLAEAVEQIRREQWIINADGSAWCYDHGRNIKDDWALLDG